MCNSNPLSSKVLGLFMVKYKDEIIELISCFRFMPHEYRRLLGYKVNMNLSEGNTYLLVIIVPNNIFMCSEEYAALCSLVSRHNLRLIVRVHPSFAVAVKSHF